MPTPFYHLNVAKELLEHPALSPELRAFLIRHRGAFLFGNTAPDVQTISGQERAATHFFDIPIRNGDPLPWSALFSKYESLAKPGPLAPERVAFLIGYLCHLQADWIWVRQIFVPVFGKSSLWGTFPRRLYLHNVLRSYLDLEILPTLGNGTAASLQQTAPAGWLPFVQDDYLLIWRNFLTEQLKPGASVKTVEVFAARQGVSPDEYYQLLYSEDRMQSEVFAFIPQQRLRHYRQSLIEENLVLIQNYLEGVPL